MLSLYRSGRQSEALDSYRAARELFVEELGIDPGPALQELEKSILQQAPTLELDAAVAAGQPDQTTARRAVLAASSREEGLDGLLALAVPLARSPGRELIVAQLVSDQHALSDQAARLHERRADLMRDGLAARVATFVSNNLGADTAKVAAEQDVDLVLLDAPPGMLNGGALPEALMTVLNNAPCDVGIVALRSDPTSVSPTRPVFVPFGGAEHDWGAVELGAWIARANDAQLVLVGAQSPTNEGDGDSSRLLARASLIIQKATGIPAEPRLVAGGTEALVEAIGGAGIAVAGLSNRRAISEPGGARHAFLRDSSAPTVFVRKGVRPGGLAPPESMTRFGWSLSLGV